MKIVAAAVSNASGTARFCARDAGSGQSGGGGGGENGGLLRPGAKAAANCSTVRAVTLDDLVDAEAGARARVFFLKVDVEGAEALVLAGAARLLAAQRISYVLFENHAKWAQAQEAAGVSPFVGVGDVVGGLVRAGYRCAYVHRRGLLPFEVQGTPSGDAARAAAECHEGLPLCARWRLYNRHFWSNILCASPSEDKWFDWLADTLVDPDETREALLKRPGT